MPGNWVERALYECCVNGGFCLQGAATDSFYRDPPATAELFADAVILAEGLDPATCRADLRRGLIAGISKLRCAPVPDFIGEDVGDLLNEMYEAGFRVSSAECNQTNSTDYVIELTFERALISVVRERDEYRFAGPTDQLLTLGLSLVMRKSELGFALRRFAGSHAGDR